MAIGTLLKANVRSANQDFVAIAQPKGTWIVCNTDCRTAQTAGMLLNPSSITSASFHWVAVPEGVRTVYVRARYPVATSGITTSPVIRVWGAYRNGGEISAAGVMPSDGSVLTARLDNASWSASGITVTLNVSNDHTDDSYFYSSLTSATGYSVLGADYIGIPVSTASSITASAAVEVQVLFA